MEVEKGMVVKSVRGHDEGFYLVVGIEEGRLLLANGKERPLEKPKKKNARHIQATGVVFDSEGIKTNRKLRELLWEFNFGGFRQKEDLYGKR